MRIEPDFARAEEKLIKSEQQLSNLIVIFAKNELDVRANNGKVEKVGVKNGRADLGQVFGNMSSGDN